MVPAPPSAADNIPEPAVNVPKVALIALFDVSLPNVPPCSEIVSNDLGESARLKVPSICSVPAEKVPPARRVAVTPLWMSINGAATAEPIERE